MIFPIEASAASGKLFESMGSSDEQAYREYNLLSSSSNTISVNIDNLGSASISVNSRCTTTGYYISNSGGSLPVGSDLNSISQGQDAQPITIPFTTSINASGNGIQKAILYLES